MKRILCKILFYNKANPVVVASLCFIGAYIGYLVWYILNHYLPASAADNSYVLVSLLSAWFCAFLGIYQLPDQLCMNRRIQTILCYPVEVRTILSVVGMRVFLLQSGICATFLYPFFLFEAHHRKEAALAMLFCCILTVALDIAVILFSILISRFCASDIVGYAFVVFQYGFFLILAWLAGNTVFSCFHKPGFLSDNAGVLKRYITGQSPAAMQGYELRSILWTWGAALTGMIVLMAVLKLAAKYWYVRGYLNVQSFRHRETEKQPSVSHIKHPYFLLEWKRVTRNKELIFFSNIKNIITVVILSRLLLHNFSQFGLKGTYVEELFLLMSCCSVNTISSTAYSSDDNKSCYAFLPISGGRLFLWKTIQGFLWGEITVLLFWFILIGFERPPVVDTFLLLFYGTSMNYVCVWLGVCIDLKMPRTVNSTNELLHGNISKVIVLITATSLTVVEIILVGGKWVPIPLLPFACLAGAGVAAGEYGYWKFCKGDFYDTDS